MAVSGRGELRHHLLLEHPLPSGGFGRIHVFAVATGVIAWSRELEVLREAPAHLVRLGASRSLLIEILAVLRGRITACRHTITWTFVQFMNLG
jgi:hypothetical protein